MNIKNIVFDFGGVLVDWNPRHLYRNYFKDEKEMEYFLANICTNEWNAEHDRGRSFDEGVRILTEKFPQYAELIRLYRDKWDVMLKGALPESVELLRQLKSEGYKLYGLTNWSAETFPVAWARFDFFRWFDGIVVSGEEKLIKPDPAIFELLLSRYGLKAEETVFIDDGPANVETAQHLGFKAIHFDNIGNVTRQLREILEMFENAASNRE
jgi:2-haloacid dehalogenase